MAEQELTDFVNYIGDKQDLATLSRFNTTMEEQQHTHPILRIGDDEDLALWWLAHNNVELPLVHVNHHNNEDDANDTLPDLITIQHGDDEDFGFMAYP